MTEALQGWGAPNPRNRFAGLAATGLLHALAVVALLQYEPVRTALNEAAPVMVSLIAPQPVVEKPRQPPKPLPDKPRATLPPAPEPRPLVNAATEAPATMSAPTPPPVAVQTPLQVAAPVAPAPVIPPSFNADYLDNPAPLYPPLSRRFGEQGKVVLRVLVNAGGSPETIELKSGSGSSRLDQAALEVVKRWRFVPARQGNQPVAAWVLIPITFSLKD